MTNPFQNGNRKLQLKQVSEFTYV